MFLSWFLDPAQWILLNSVKSKFLATCTLSLLCTHQFCWFDPWPTTILENFGPISAFLNFEFARSSSVNSLAAKPSKVMYLLSSQTPESLGKSEKNVLTDDFKLRPKKVNNWRPRYIHGAKSVSSMAIQANIVFACTLWRMQFFGFCGTHFCLMMAISPTKKL